MGEDRKAEPSSAEQPSKQAELRLSEEAGWRSWGHCHMGICNMVVPRTKPTGPSGDNKDPLPAAHYDFAPSRH